MFKVKGKSNKKVYTSIFQQYIIFVFLIFIIFMVGILLTSISIGKMIYSKEYSQNVEKFFKASPIVNGDYKNIDASKITSIGGWVEILDRDKKLIYVIGEKKDLIKAYTEDEIINMLENNLERDIDKKYIYSVKIFNKDKKKYYCITKTPLGVISIDIDKEEVAEKYILPAAKKIITGFLVIIFYIIIVILLYASWTSRKIVKPLREMFKGIKKITDGDYSVNIDFKANNEFSEIKDAINLMAQKIRESEIERKTIEKFKQQLFTDISHDLKTPITSIQGYSKALYDGVIDDEEKKKIYFKTIYDKSVRLTTLVESIHELAKLGNDKYSIHKEKIDICEFLRELITEFYQEIEDKRFDFIIEIPEKSIVYEIDKNEMARAISNIISNSLKYNPINTKFKIQLDKVHNKIQILICDNGIGIDDNLKDIIFEAFTRADLSRITTGGTGLGLSIASKIIEKHGGMIFLESDGDYKTIFRILI